MIFKRGVVRFVRNLRGTSALIFTSALLAILPAVGCVVDFRMYLTQKAKVQAALDFTSIALAKYVSNNLDASQQTLETIANDFFDGELKGTPMLDMQDVNVARMGMRLNLDVDGTMPTSIMQITGVDTMSLYTDAEVVYGVASKLEVALVLDTSTSMNIIDTGETESRIASLRTAAQDMVQTLMRPEDSDDSDLNVPVKMSLVPFSNRINVGEGKGSKGWISVPEDFTHTQTSCHIPLSWYQSNCTPDTHDCADDEAGGQCGTFICDPDEEAAAERDCVTSSLDYSWYGCVEPRTTANHLVDGNYGVEKIPGFPSTSANECASKMVDMTADPSRLKRDIGNMEVRSRTYIPAGLMWGFRTLTAQAPFRTDKTIDQFMAEGGSKSLVLMSDGANTLAPEADGSMNGDDYSAADPNTEKVCDLIKSANVEIYVVAYNITDADTMSLLKGCASSETRFFEASSTDALKRVFKTITQQLARDISLAG